MGVKALPIDKVLLQHSGHYCQTPLPSFDHDKTQRYQPTSTYTYHQSWDENTGLSIPPLGSFFRGPGNIYFFSQSRPTTWVHSHIRQTQHAAPGAQPDSTTEATSCCTCLTSKNRTANDKEQGSWWPSMILWIKLHVLLLPAHWFSCVQWKLLPSA